MPYIPNDHQWQTRVLIPGPSGALYRQVALRLSQAGQPASPEAVAGYLWRLGPHVTNPENAIRDLNHLAALAAGETALPAPAGPPTDLAVRGDEVGHWKGHFLRQDDFFSPALASLPAEARQGIFRAHRADGYTHVLINAQQDDWGPRKGRPEWTHGGFDAYQGNQMPRLVAALEEARRAGLAPWVGVLDQPALALPIGEIVAKTRDLVAATWTLTAGYMLSWEIREVWRDSREREDREDTWISSIDWHGRDVGIHYQAAHRTVEDEDPGLGGGVTRYRQLETIYPGHVVRMLQYHHAASDATLREQTRRTCQVVHVDHGLGKFMCFEHSSEENQPITYDRAGVERRRGVIMREVVRSGLEGVRGGFLN